MPCLDVGWRSTALLSGDLTSHLPFLCLHWCVSLWDGEEATLLRSNLHLFTQSPLDFMQKKKSSGRGIPYVPVVLTPLFLSLLFFFSLFFLFIRFSLATFSFSESTLRIKRVTGKSNSCSRCCRNSFFPDFFFSSPRVRGVQMSLNGPSASILHSPQLQL